MTVEEFWAYSNRPENFDRRLELIRGEVVEWSVPYTRHGIVCSRASCLLGEYAHSLGAGLPLAAGVGVILGREPDTVVGPDVCWYATQDPGEDAATGWLAEPPVLVVEVLSGNDDRGRLLDKVGCYTAAGVRVVWLADSVERTLTVFRPRAAPVPMGMSDELSGSPELPEFVCRVGDFFRLPGERRGEAPAA